MLNLIEDLRRSQTGNAYYTHIQNILEEYERTSLSTQQAYAGLLQVLLKGYARGFPTASPQRVNLALIEKRLREPLTASEIAGLRGHVEALADAALEPRAAALDLAAQALAPLTEQPPAAPAPPPQDEPAPAPVPGRGDRRVDFTYRKRVDDKRDRIRKIQETLAQHVHEVIKQNEKFGVLLEVEHETLRQTVSLKELEELRQALLTEVVRLMEGHNALAKKLDSASQYLQIIESEGQHLNEELARVHILSLTDELTDLPNRRAFTRQLEDEVARVQRYGYPLSVALIDMDGFKGINDKYGHAAGDEVLRNFASNVLTVFRHHDLVARYGGEEFAVLLPNTNSAGAQRALEKVRRRSTECPYQLSGKAMPMPTFSAGIALYKPGETPSDLIERTDKALYRAKRLGRNRIEIAAYDVSAEGAGA